MSVKCALCRQSFEPSEELCGECVDKEATTWSRKKPTTPGWHWVRWKSGVVEVVKVWRGLSGRWYAEGRDGYSGGVGKVPFEDCCWQPVAPPKE